MANIEVHPPIFPIMQIKQSGAYITHSAWFYYRIRRISDNAIVFSCMANSQAYGANNHPPESYIQLAPGMYEWDVCNLSKSRAILQAFVMRSDNNNQGDGVVSAGGSNNPLNAVCYGQVHGGKRVFLNFEVKEYAPGGTQWYHINLSYWFINGTGDTYTLDAPNNTAGFYSTDITSIVQTDSGTKLTWDNPEVFGPVALITNSEKIVTTLGEVTNPFYIPATTIPPTTGSVVTLPAGKKILYDAFDLFNKYFNASAGIIFKRNPFTFRYTPGTFLEKFGEFTPGKKAWYKNSNPEYGFVGRPEDLNYPGTVENQLVGRHGDTVGLYIHAQMGSLPDVDYLNSKYGVFIQKISAVGDIRVTLKRSTNNLLDVIINDTDPHYYSLNFLANGVGTSYNTWLEISKGNLAFNPDNLVSFSFTCEVNFFPGAFIGGDTQYRKFDKGVIEFEDCEDQSDFLLGVCYYPVPDYVPGNVFDDVVWLGKLHEVWPLEVDLDSFYIFIKKISTDTIIAVLKYPEDTV